MASQVKWVVLTATKAEAAPLISHFSLAKSRSINGYSTYQDDALLLMVTGVGYNAAFQAVEILWQTLANANDVDVINIGIAGAKTLAVGSLVWPQHHSNIAINLPQSLSVQDQQAWYNLVSVSQVVNQYDEGTIYDMEFAAIHHCLTTNEHIGRLFCAKVISDNASHAASRITPQSASELIRMHLGQFAQLF